MEERFVINEKPEIKIWDDFVHSHPCGNIFQSSLMFDLYASTPRYTSGVVALENKNKEILALIVYVVMEESGIKSSFSRRAIISGGPLIKDNNAEYASLLLKNYSKIIKKTKVIYSELRNLFDVKSLDVAFSKENFIYEDHLTIHMDLTKSVDELEKAVNRKRSSNIKRAIKKNVTTKIITNPIDIETAYALIKDTYERISLPIPSAELFLNGVKFLPSNVKFFAAFLDGKLIACRVYLIYKHIIYDWYAAVDRDFSALNPGDVLPWHAMLWAKENNITLYDFAGAGKPNQEYKVRDYKIKFGGSLLNLGRYKCIHRPLLYKIGVLGIKYYKHFQ